MKYTPNFPHLPSGECFYYKGKELVTAEEKARIEKLWGPGWSEDTRYVERFWYDESFQTGLPDVLNVLATIQCDRKLNERESTLSRRIAKGNLTYSKSSSYVFVEQKMAWELFNDGLELYNKENPEARIKHQDYSAEVYRVYGLPNYHSIMRKVEEQEKKIGTITKPEKKYRLNFHYEGSASFESAYKCYGVFLDREETRRFEMYGSFSNSTFMKNLKKACPYVGKLYFSDLFEKKYWQIYVYDNADSDWALQNVVHFMMTYQGEIAESRRR